MLLPDEAVLFGVQFTFDFTESDEHGIVILVCVPLLSALENLASADALFAIG